MTALNISYLIISPHLLNRRNWGNLLLFFRNKGHVSVCKNTQGKNKERAASRGLLFAPTRGRASAFILLCGDKAAALQFVPGRLIFSVEQHLGVWPAGPAFFANSKSDFIFLNDLMWS